MKIDYFFFFFIFFSLLVNIECLIVLSQSNATTKLVSRITNFTTYVNGFSVYGLIPQTPTAMLISNYQIAGLGSCITMNIQDVFQIPCLTKSIYAYVGYAEIYTFYLNGKVLRSGYTLSTADNFTIDRSQYQCGVDINLTIQVRKNACPYGDLQLVYAIVSDYNPNLQGSQLQLKNIQESHNNWTKEIIIGICLLVFIFIIAFYFIYTLNKRIQRMSKMIKPQRIINSSNKNCCSICLGINCDMKTLCGHIFHSKCFIQWIMKTPSCPTCRNKNIDIVKVVVCLKCMEIYQHFETLKRNFFIDIESWRKKIQEVHVCEEKNNYIFHMTAQRFERLDQSEQ